MTIGNHRFTRGFIRAAQFLGFAGPGPGLSPTVIPTLPFERLAGTAKIQRAKVQIVGNGDFVMHRVPEGEIWQCVWLNYGVDDGDYTIDTLWILDDLALPLLRLDGSNVTNPIKEPGAAVAAMLPHLWLYPGQVMGIQITNFVNAGDADLNLWTNVIDYNPDSRE